MTTTDRLKLWVETILRAYDARYLTRGGAAAMLVLAIVQAARAPMPTSKWIATTAGTSNVTVTNVRRRSIEIGVLTENGYFPDSIEEVADPAAEAAVRDGTIQQLAWQLRNPSSPT